MATEGTAKMYDRIKLLGNAQDAGRPQLGCTEKCCEDARRNTHLSRMPVSLGLHGEQFGIVEATRCIGDQISLMGNSQISEVWLTHAHLGHIEGLGQFGRESFNSKNVKLRCSESVANYVMKHPIWKKLIERGNLTFDKFKSDIIVPIEVPHRAQDFDTHAILFKGKNNNILFLPDHDTWEKTLDFVEYNNPKEWFSSLEANIILLDGTFWNSSELKGRIQADVPHPTVSETIDLIGERSANDPRVIFIHLNHTNPLHYPDSVEYQKLVSLGWEVGEEGMVLNL
jgi:pyrroloquinoline quinone biosynthesis protein B